MLPGLMQGSTSSGKNNLLSQNPLAQPSTEEMREIEEARMKLQESFLESIKPQVEEINSILAYMEDTNKFEEISSEWGMCFTALASDYIAELSGEGYNEQYLQTMFPDIMSALLYGFSIGITMGKGVQLVTTKLDSEVIKEQTSEDVMLQNLID